MVRWVCLNCGWVGEQPKFVRIPRVAWENPFVPETEILCPKCGKLVQLMPSEDEIEPFEFEEVDSNGW